MRTQTRHKAAQHSMDDPNQIIDTWNGTEVDTTDIYLIAHIESIKINLRFVDIGFQCIIVCRGFSFLEETIILYYYLYFMTTLSCSLSIHLN